MILPREYVKALSEGRSDMIRRIHHLEALLLDHRICAECGSPFERVNLQDMVVYSLSCDCLFHYNYEGV